VQKFSQNLRVSWGTDNLSWIGRSADERAARDGTRRTAGSGSVTSVNSSAVKRLFADDDATKNEDTKHCRRDDIDKQVFTLKVRVKTLSDSCPLWNSCVQGYSSFR